MEPLHRGDEDGLENGRVASVMMRESPFEHMLVKTRMPSACCCVTRAERKRRYLKMGNLVLSGISRQSSIF